MTAESGDPDLGNVFDDVLQLIETGKSPSAEQRETLPDNFNETRYLRAFPDIADAVQSGASASAADHFIRHGKDELRLDSLEYRHGWPLHESAAFPRFGIDAAFWTRSGRVMVIGWIDDAEGLVSIGLNLHETLLGATAGVARCRREDAERAVGAAEGNLLGFWSVFNARTNVHSPDTRLTLATRDGHRSVSVTMQDVSDERLRHIAFEYLAHASYWGHPQVEAFDFLDGGLGRALISANELISQAYVANAFCRRFGPQPGRFKGSIIVCLYGRAEYMFLQAALFSRCSASADYEFVYVSNSPELTENMFREAAIIAQIYRLSITIVMLSGNAGFGAANNAAVAYAQSDRIMIVNPDVFPRGDDWAQLHTAAIENLPGDQSRIFGVPLYYDDGSLMHAGMFFELDDGFSVKSTGVRHRLLARVEHYAKGAPPDTQRFLASRPVPAITGAFMSIERSWFERLGGFSPEFVFGHYEDADLCLRSLEQGTQVWLHPVPFWHMEGKGSTRRPVHEGGSLLNRWHFTQLWTEIIQNGLLGPQPSRLVTS